MTSDVLRAWFACLLLVFAGAVCAQSPEGEPVASAPLKDAEFGVTTRQFALQRRVEMYQWQRDASGYRQGPVPSGERARDESSIIIASRTI